MNAGLAVLRILVGLLFVGHGAQKLFGLESAFGLDVSGLDWPSRRSARATAARSLLDEADRRVREREGISHQDKVDLRASLERARALLEGELVADGTRAVAVFAADSAGVFEIVRLPRSVGNRVAIGRS